MITTANHPGQRVLFVLLVMLLSLSGFAQNKPFPQAVSWPGCIKPNNVTQATLNSDVTAYYTYWKSQHLKQSTVNTQRYYVKANSTGGSAEAITNSEAHGYGMLITVLMAGYDANAKTYYDGLYRMYDSHRSVNNNNLMQWQVMPDERSRNIGSATDGDMDIAYSLLLAHFQWGSTGAINYLDAAKKMITNGLKASYISPALRLRLADDEGYDDYSHALPTGCSTTFTPLPRIPTTMYGTTLPRTYIRYTTRSLPATHPTPVLSLTLLCMPIPSPRRPINRRKMKDLQPVNITTTHAVCPCAWLWTMHSITQQAPRPLPTRS